MPLRKKFGSIRKRRTSTGLLGGILLIAFGLSSFSGCSMMPSPAKRLVNHISTKASETKIREKVENDKFPTAKEAGLD